MVQLSFVSMATSTTQSGQNSAQQSQTTGKKNSHMLLYIAVAAIIVIIAIIYLAIPSGGGPFGKNPARPNSTPIYLSVSNAQKILGTTIINYTVNYTTASIYNYSTPYNATFLESMVPALVGNVTNGWVTFAFGSSANNASIVYAVIQTNNASNIATIMASVFASSFTTIPNVTHGVENGMDYTYESERNSTQSYQALVGWKDGYVLSAQIVANNFTANQTEIAQVVSSTV